jgi:hypothetical protein
MNFLDPIVQYDVVVVRHPKVPERKFPYRVPKDTCCWWDKHPIDSGIAVSCITSSDGPKKYNLEGLFCSWACSIAYGLEHRSDYVRRACDSFTRRFLRDIGYGHIITGSLSKREQDLGQNVVARPLTFLEKKAGNVIERYPLEAAPHWSTLKCFQTNKSDGITIEAFRHKRHGMDMQTYWSERGPMFIHDLEIAASGDPSKAVKCSFRAATTVIEIVKCGDLDYIPPEFPLDLSAMVKKEDETKIENDDEMVELDQKGVFVKKKKGLFQQKRKNRPSDPTIVNKKIRQHELGQKRVYRLKQTRLVQHDTVIGACGTNSLAKFMIKPVKPEK